MPCNTDFLTSLLDTRTFGYVEQRSTASVVLSIQHDAFIPHPSVNTVHPVGDSGFLGEQIAAPKTRQITVILSQTPGFRGEHLAPPQTRYSKHVMRDGCFADFSIMRRIPVFEGANVSLMRTSTTSTAQITCISHVIGMVRTTSFMFDFVYDSKFVSYPNYFGASLRCSP